MKKKTIEAPVSWSATDEGFSMIGSTRRFDPVPASTNSKF